ncbi:uncharacterized protein [Lolium perenne]|nr:uncharacterized protein LOC127297268 isoform X2 [Lolium perenne]
MSMLQVAAAGTGEQLSEEPAHTLHWFSASLNGVIMGLFDERRLFISFVRKKDIAPVTRVNGPLHVLLEVQLVGLCIHQMSCAVIINCVEHGDAICIK